VKLNSIIFLSLAFILAISSGLVFASAIQIEGAERVFEVRAPGEDYLLGRPLVCSDLDSDGLEDIVIGADVWDNEGNQVHPVYLFHGRGGFGDNDLVDLSSESADVVIYGETGSYDFANSLESGDVNGDGIQDLILADSTFSPPGRTAAGVLYILFGRTNFFNTTTYDFGDGDWDVKILGAYSGDDLGGAGMAPFGGSTSHAVATGDINDDNIDDIVVGAHFSTAGSNTLAGNAYIIYGKTSLSSGTTIDLLTQADSVIQGNEKDAEMGTDIAIGDVSGDGVDDIVLGEELGSNALWSSEGRVFVFYGGSGFPSSTSLSSADLSIYGDNKGDQLGDAVAVSDVNGDGTGDILALAYGWDSAGVDTVSAGAIYGFFGGSELPSSINLAFESSDFFVEGYNETNSLYWSLEGADFNGDGIGDFMFTSRDGERPGYNSEGRTFIVLGKSSFPSEISVENEEVDYIINGGMDYLQLCDTFCSGDIDGDGADEILLGAPFVDSWTGRALLFDLNPRTAVSAFWSMYE